MFLLLFSIAADSSVPPGGTARGFDCGHSMLHIRAMRLGYFTMPPHPPHRDPAQTLQENREAIVLAHRRA